jgi:hypothetical protein
MQKQFLIVVLLFLSVLPQYAYAAYGKSGWSIFRKLQSAQFKSISATTPGYANVSGMIYNPAIASTFEEKQLFLMSEKGFSDDMLHGMLFETPLKVWTIAGGLIYYDAGEVELNWVENGALQTTTVSLQKDILGMVSFSRWITENMHAGITLKAANSELAQRYSARAYAADVGWVYSPAKWFSMSLAVTVQRK